MINFVNSDAWNPAWEKARDGQYFVDISECATAEQAAKRIGGVVSGEQSPILVRGNLDALIDVMGEFFYERWGEEIAIYVKGSRLLSNALGIELARLILCFDSAFDRATFSASHSGSIKEYMKAKQNVFVYFCLN
jgi:hypothetical protein